MPTRLPVLRVAAPCPFRWEDLAGDDRVRFCGKCQQHVYNVESLRPEEIRTLVERREGRVCVRLLRRSDGTVITRDCWYVLRRVRQRLVATFVGVAVAAVGYWGGIGLLTRRLWALRADGPTCPEPLPQRASLPELPDPEIPVWLVPGHGDEQGARNRGNRMGVKPRRRAAPKPPVPPKLPARPEPKLDDMGLMAMPL